MINLLCQLKIDLTGYNFSHLRIGQADLRGVNLHDVNFAYSNLAESVLNENLSIVRSAEFSPDGKFLATGDADCQICLWKVAIGQQLFTFKGHTNWVQQVTFSPDGVTLASGSSDHTVKLWNTRAHQSGTVSCL